MLFTSSSTIPAFSIYNPKARVFHLFSAAGFTPSSIMTTIDMQGNVLGSYSMPFIGCAKYRYIGSYLLVSLPTNVRLAHSMTPWSVPQCPMAAKSLSSRSTTRLDKCATCWPYQRRTKASGSAHSILTMKRVDWCCFNSLLRVRAALFV
jgi:hypothetical protein